MRQRFSSHRARLRRCATLHLGCRSSGIQGGDGGAIVIRLTGAQQVAHQRGVALAFNRGVALSGAGIDSPGLELGFQPLRLFKGPGAIELQLPAFAGLAIDVEHAGTATHHFVAHSTIDVESLLVERIDAVFTRLQMQCLVIGTKHGIGAAYPLPIDTLDFKFIGDDNGKNLLFRQSIAWIELYMGLLRAGDH